MNLTRLVCYGERDPSQSFDFADLVGTCEKMGLTGLIHHHEDYFIAALEGGRVDLSTVFLRIAADPKHLNVVILSAEDARERYFLGAMATHRGMDERSVEAFRRYFATEEIDPAVVNVDSLLDALQDLAAEL